jgi:PQQ-like domain
LLDFDLRCLVLPSRPSRTSPPRRLALPALALLGALLLAACGDVAPPRGWAAPVALPSSSSGAAGEQVFVIQSEPGKLTAVAVTAAGASERWKFPTDDDDFDLTAIYATPVLDGARLIVAAYSGDVLALDPTSGRPIIGWGGKLTGKVVSDPVVNSARTFLLVTTDHGAVHPVSLGSGAIFPARTTEQLRVYGSGAAVSSTVVYGSIDRRLFAIQDSTGEVLWSVPSAPLLGDMEAIGDRVVVGTVGGRVAAYGATDGKERWSFQGNAWVWAAPLAAAGRLYVADLDGRVFALDSSTGAEIWRTATPRGDVRGSPVLAGSALVVASSSGAVFGIDPASGAELWYQQPNVGRLLASPLVLESGVLFLSDSGTLIRVQPTDGTFETIYKRS